MPYCAISIAKPFLKYLSQKTSVLAFTILKAVSSCKSAVEFLLESPWQITSESCVNHGKTWRTVFTNSVSHGICKAKKLLIFTASCWNLFLLSFSYLHLSIFVHPHFITLAQWCPFFLDFYLRRANYAGYHHIFQPISTLDINIPFGFATMATVLDFSKLV